MIQHALREIAAFVKFATAPTIVVVVMVGCAVGGAFVMPPLVWYVKEWASYWDWF